MLSVMDSSRVSAFIPKLSLWLIGRIRTPLVRVTAALTVLFPCARPRLHARDDLGRGPDVRAEEPFAQRCPILNAGMVSLDPRVARWMVRSSLSWGLVRILILHCVSLRPSIHARPMTKLGTDVRAGELLSAVRAHVLLVVVPVAAALAQLVPDVVAHVQVVAIAVVVTAVDKEVSVLVFCLCLPQATFARPSVHARAARSRGPDVRAGEPWFLLFASNSIRVTAVRSNASMSLVQCTRKPLVRLTAAVTTQFPCARPRLHARDDHARGPDVRAGEPFAQRLATLNAGVVSFVPIVTRCIVWPSLSSSLARSHLMQCVSLQPSIHARPINESGTDVRAGELLSIHFTHVRIVVVPVAAALVEPVPDVVAHVRADVPVPVLVKVVAIAVDVAAVDNEVNVLVVFLSHVDAATLLPRMVDGALVALIPIAFVVCWAGPFGPVACCLFGVLIFTAAGFQVSLAVVELAVVPLEFSIRTRSVARCGLLTQAVGASLVVGVLPPFSPLRAASCTPLSARPFPSDAFIVDPPIASTSSCLPPLLWGRSGPSSASPAVSIGVGGAGSSQQGRCCAKPLRRSSPVSCLDRCFASAPRLRMLPSGP